MLIRTLGNIFTPKKSLSFRECLNLNPLDKFNWAIRTVKSGGSQMTETSFLQYLTDFLQQSGVASPLGTQFQVTQQGTPNMSVQTAVGHAYLLVASGNGYPINSDSIVNTNINANASGNPRITSIVLYLNTATSPNSDVSNIASIIAVDGTPGASPSAPSAGTIQTAIGSSSYPYIVLANITVASGATSIVTANITDVRQPALFNFGLNGWVSLATTLTYSSTDGHTFVCTTSNDMTGTVQACDRIWLFNQSANQYFIVTAITSSTITLYGGTNYSITNTAITNPFFSHAKSPFGFSTDPAIWTEKLTDTNNLAQSSPVSGTWYNLGLSLAVPIGKWNLEYSAALRANSGGTGEDISATLSTANNSESDSDLTTFIQSLTNIDKAITVYKHKYISLASKTTYFFNIKTVNTTTSINIYGNQSKTIINAFCAYL